ncbi:hypothetical protein [Prosthecobacter sp.]|uniref:hypothetical protein n=1 Tax=Prosthecobacter sp. TaxID=1965333 RepID=UPI00378508EC
MKLTPFILALMIAHVSAAEPASPQRLWKPDTPGLTLEKAAHYDAPTGTFEITASDEALQRLFVDTQPKVGAHSYALRGEVKYEQVGGTGFLETWTSLDENKAFSRTLGEQGPMGKLTGTSAWREFVLPMNLMGSSTPVKQIEMNVVLPDGGKVWLRNLRIETMNFAPAKSSWALLVSVAAGVGVIIALLVWRSRRRHASEDEIKRMMAADV